MLFPAYREKQYPNPTLVFLEDNKLVWSHGAMRAIDSFSDLYSIVYRENLQVLCHKLLHLPGDYLYKTILAGEVLCDKKTGPKSAILKYKRNVTRQLVQWGSWGFKYCSTTVLKTLSELFRACGVGVRSTPAALGQALMRALFPAWAIRHGPPRADAQRALREHGCGGRAQLFRVSEKIDCIELDRGNGYAAEARDYGFPTGTTYTVTRDRVPSEYAAWYCDCTIRIRDTLAPGPFGIRTENGTLAYPCDPGVYRAWLWDFQYASCQAAGLDITINRGFGWRELTHDLDEWVTVCTELRNLHPLMKRAIVQGLGRFNMKPVRRILVLEPQEQEVEDEEDINVMNEWGERYRLWSHAKPDNRVWQGPHWYSYNTTRQADATYRLARDLWPHVLAVNFDAVYVDKSCPGVENFKPKAETKTGEWGRSLYKMADLLKNRWFDGIDEQGRRKLSTPGQPHGLECDCEKCLEEAA